MKGSCRATAAEWGAGSPVPVGAGATGAVDRPARSHSGHQDSLGGKDWGAVWKALEEENTGVRLPSSGEGKSGKELSKAL